jgi:putative hemolysin
MSPTFRLAQTDSFWYTGELMSNSSNPSSTCEYWTLQPIQAAGEEFSRWNQCDVLTFPAQVGKRLVCGLAASDRCRNAALRLRHEVFCVELEHGSADAEVDKDQFDDQMSHIVLLEAQTGTLVGTYRIQSVEHAHKHNGLYSAQEFFLEPLGDRLQSAAECGRACIAASFRKATSLLALWSGLNQFMAMNSLRWLFGCCSVSSHDPDDGWRTLKTLRSQNFMHPEILLQATPEFSCGSESRADAPDLGDALPIPKLFAAYMRLGVRVVSLPALDRDFGTIDFLVLADARAVNMSSLGFD